jgi:CheY-like chemotaxis protein
MNGYEATTQIRRMENSNRQVPAVAMTAQAIDGSRGRCLEHGMDDFIAKPVKLEDLTRALEVGCARRTRKGHGPRQAWHE